jgi:integrase
MTNYNAENERVKRRYFTFLKEAMRQNEQTVDGVAKALSRFEDYTKYKSFKAFHHNQAVGFKNHLAKEKGASGKPLSKATLNSTLAALKRFFQWLYGQPGYKSRFQYTDAEYFNLSEKDVRVASAKRQKKYPSLEQINHVLELMPYGTEIEKRNRALIAFVFLTGARDSAVASMRLKHVDLVEGSIDQDAREVKTKFSKSFKTYFFPVGDRPREIFEEWVQFLKKVKLWGSDDSLFPTTLVKRGDSKQFEVVGLDRKCWSNATPIRNIFKQAFEAAGLDYYNPHSFRDTLVKLGEQRCSSPEEFKAWSQNLGHEKVLTTFYSYGEVGSERQGELIKNLVNDRNYSKDELTELFQRILSR